MQRAMAHTTTIVALPRVAYARIITPAQRASERCRIAARQYAAFAYAACLRARYV